MRFPRKGFPYDILLVSQRSDESCQVSKYFSYFLSDSTCPIRHNNSKTVHFFRKGNGFCHKLKFFNPYIFAIQCCRHLTFQTMNSVRSNNISLKYQYEIYEKYPQNIKQDKKYSVLKNSRRNVKLQAIYL